VWTAGQGVLRPCTRWYGAEGRTHSRDPATANRRRSRSRGDPSSTRRCQMNGTAMSPAAPAIAGPTVWRRCGPPSIVVRDQSSSLGRHRPAPVTGSPLGRNAGHAQPLSSPASHLDLCYSTHLRWLVGRSDREAVADSGPRGRRWTCPWQSWILQSPETNRRTLVATAAAKPREKRRTTSFRSSRDIVRCGTDTH